ncbi:MAG: long-chain fatty acid--CoA ligase [Sphingomonadales bacterium]|nr:MAG: long-chain fatty acid--CoA ligase [Sphingomonadales bacterium]
MSYILSGERSIQLGDIRERAARAASGFHDLGIAAGDRIALYLRNDPAMIEASIAAGLIGAYPTPVNWHYVPAEVDYLLTNSGARALIVHADLLAGVKAILPAALPVLVIPTPPEIVAAFGIADARAQVPDGFPEWDDWLAQFPAYAGPPVAAPGTIIYTSGTTGKPKGVLRQVPSTAQKKLAADALLNAYHFSPFADDPSRIVAMVTSPMYHTAPNFYGLLAIQFGANLVLQPRFDAEGLLALVARHKVTHLIMVPIMFHRLLALPEEVKRKYDLSSLRQVFHGAAPCPRATKEAMIAWWGPIFDECYGSTEVSLVTFCNSNEWLAHPGTVGRTTPDAEIRILDAAGNALPPGEIGEIVARNSSLAEFTYHGDDAKRAAADRDGFVALGDVGYFDADGYLYLCDRVQDLIISGGANIYPLEIESQLHEMPGVRDCAVLGVPDAEYGEAVLAIVERQPGVAIDAVDIRAFLRGRVAPYKIPRRIEFRSNLPREDSGKIFKRKLRDEFWAGAGRKI